MGTNYYYHEDSCPTCGHSEKVTHIGKSSAGWTFSFHGTDEIRSWKDWQTLLATGGRIVDEYDGEISVADFKAMVEQKKTEKFNHSRDLPQQDSPYYKYMDETYGAKYNGFESAYWAKGRAQRGLMWLDEEGNSFDAGEFS